MGDENQTYTANTDGTISIKNTEGKTLKYVLESDLGAVKVQLKDKEGEVSTLQSNLATSNTKYDTEHQAVLQERAAKEQFEKEAKEGTGLKDKVTGLETQVADLTKASGETATKLTDQLRTTLQTTYKVDPTKLADKTLVDLEQIQNALQLTGVVPAPANYDGKGGEGGTGGDLAGKSPLALAVMDHENSAKE